MNVFWKGFETSGLPKIAKMERRPMEADVTARMGPTMVLGFNPMLQKSKLLLQRLDNALQKVSGLKRMKIIALNPLFDKQVMAKLGLGSLSISLYRQGKPVASIEGLQTEMGYMKFLQENRGRMA